MLNMLTILNILNLSASVVLPQLIESKLVEKEERLHPAPASASVCSEKPCQMWSLCHQDASLVRLVTRLWASKAPEE